MKKRVVGDVNKNNQLCKKEDPWLASDMVLMSRELNVSSMKGEALEQGNIINRG